MIKVIFNKGFLESIETSDSSEFERILDIVLKNNFLFKIPEEDF